VAAELFGGRPVLLNALVTTVTNRASLARGKRCRAGFAQMRRRLSSHFREFHHWHILCIGERWNLWIAWLGRATARLTQDKSAGGEGS
jgi:hypothetical protein